MNDWRDRLRGGTDSLARWSAVVMLFAVPISKPLFNLASALMLLGWLLAGRWREYLQVLRGNPLTLPALLLVGLVLVGTTYTPAPLDYVSRHWYVYSRVLLMLPLLTLFHDAIWRARGLVAFAAGGFVTLLSTYANLGFLLPWSASQNLGLGHSHHVFMDYIAQGLVMSCFCALAIRHALASGTPRGRVFWAATALLAAFSVTHLLQSRTSQVVLVAMLLVVMLIAAPRRWRYPAVLATAALIGVATLTSELISSRFLMLIAEAREYWAHGTNIVTSTGARLDMWRHGLAMFGDSPLWGHGTSSYRVLAEQVFLDKAACDMNCIHPHNQFLFFAIEFGILGAVAYGLLLWRPFRCALREAAPDRVLMIGFLTIMLVDSFINAPLWVTTERQFYTVMLPLLFAGCRWPPARHTDTVAT